MQGTVYSDAIESGAEGTQLIKTHHNVGGLPEVVPFELLEPLRTLFKDEVRKLALELGIEEEFLWRHPAPGPGLAVRIVGSAVTMEHLQTLRCAEAILQQEIEKAGLSRDLWQCFCVLQAGIKSIGTKGDRRSYEHPIVIRAVTSENAMTASWGRIPDALLNRISQRITNEIPQANRVVLDITAKPPGCIEWE
jgi:GMP synthase (glutamine-hydrolysing)